jgi:hypothetical protein
VHNFHVHQLPDDVTLMVCKCGLTYQWRLGYWREVGFEDKRGTDTEPPASQCVEPERDQEGGE